MAQLFTKSADSIFRTSVVGFVILLSLIVSAMLGLARTSYMTDEDVVVKQPVPFSHQHHVGDIGIDCRYCHQTVEYSSRASIPASEVCMNCHRELWKFTQMLAPVRESYRSGVPIAWNRVHDLPDYVYFNHSIHIQSGIGCYSCHGNVDEMALIYQEEPLTMQWCLDCHRNPERNVRPRELVFKVDPLRALLDEVESVPEKEWSSIEELRSILAKKYELERLTDCYTCHR